MSSVDHNMMPVGDSSAHIALKVKTQDGKEVYFKMRSQTKLKKLMIAFCGYCCVDLKNVAFVFNSLPIQGEQTPNQLGMKNGDEIGAMVHLSVIRLDAAMATLQL